MNPSWTLDRLILYSHDGRSCAVDFFPKGLTVICSGSHTGKSSLIEIVDYTLGASRWRAADRVRTTTAWVAAVWLRGEHRVFAGRRVPTGSKRESSECSFIVLGDSEPPENHVGISANCNTEGLKHALESQFGIGFVMGESFGKRFDESKVSVRNGTPYLFQSDDVIVNKTQLLRGFSGEKRTGNLAAAPYYLGVIDEHTTTDANRLAFLKRQRKALERQVSAHDAAEYSVGPTTQKLTAEAVELGLLDHFALQAPVEECQALLANLENHVELYEILESTNPQLASLRDEQSAQLEVLGRTTVRRRDAAAMLKASTFYTDAVFGQKQRLEAVHLFNDVDIGTCPVCESSVDHSPVVRELHDALGELRQSLSGVTRDRPKLEEHIRQLDTEAHQIRTTLVDTRTRIAALVQEQENVKRRLALGARRERFMGRLSLYLETLPDDEELKRLQGLLNEVRGEVELLDARLARSSIAKQMEQMRQRVSHISTQIMRELPGDNLLHTGRLDVDLRKMEVGLQTAARRLSMEEVGSDENYLTIHLAVVLALHRVFATDCRPLPTVIFLDQISRPYFPSDVDAPVSVSSSNEREKLAQYIDALGRELERNAGLQIILLEHAYLTDHQGYTTAAKHVWSEGEGLIPSDWPVTDDN